MCRMCEGLSFEEVLALDAAKIAEDGFVVIAVGGPGGEDNGRGWAYTVGLLDAADHPEMIVAGGSIQLGGSVLSLLARSVLDEGERYDPGETIATPSGVARVGAVHEIQYELGTFNMWHEQRRSGMLRTSKLAAVQIVLPSGLFCSTHRHVQPRLSDPNARLGLDRPHPNRAERRRRRPHRPSS